MHPLMPVDLKESVRKTISILKIRLPLMSLSEEHLLESLASLCFSSGRENGLKEAQEMLHREATRALK